VGTRYKTILHHPGIKIRETKTPAIPNQTQTTEATLKTTINKIAITAEVLRRTKVTRVEI